MKKIYILLSLLVTAVFANAQCTELFFSEYAEGSSNNKYMEVYNPSNTAVDLSSYKIFQIGNGGSFTNELALSGTIDPYDVYIFCADQADATILAAADTALSFPSVAHFNGDDAMFLLKGTDTIDRLGLSYNRQNYALDSGGTTKDQTIVRLASVKGPQTDWSIGSGEWNVYAQNTWTFIGSHFSDCAPATEPQNPAPDPTHAAVDVISIYSESYSDPAGIDYYPNSGQSTQYSVFEIGMDSMIKYSALNYQGIDFNASEIDASSMEMLHLDIWTADVDDVDIFPISRASGEKAVKKTLTAGVWNSIDIDLSDYTSQGLSMADIFQFKFDNLGASRGIGTIFLDNMYLWKKPTLVYKESTIKDAIQLDADLAPTNVDSLFELTGVVYGIDLDGNAGISFTMIDATSGINVFNFVDVDNYVVTEGDEITVKGKIAFYNGLLEIMPDSIMVNSTGNTIAEPLEVEKPTEDTESEFIQLRKVWVADGSTTWPDNGNVELTNDAMDTFQIRIDRDIPGMVGENIPFDTMVIVGIGGQFDPSSPYNEGYQIFPRGPMDITEYEAPASVTELNPTSVVLFPNPAGDVLYISTKHAVENIKILSLTGAVVAEFNGASSISLETISTGLYLVEVYTNAGVATKKVAVSK